MFSHLLVFATFQEQQGSVHSSFWQHNLVYVTASSSTQLPTRQVAVAWVLQRPAATAEAYADSSGPDSGSFQQRSVHSQHVAALLHTNHSLLKNPVSNKSCSNCLCTAEHRSYWRSICRQQRP